MKHFREILEGILLRLLLISIVLMIFRAGIVDEAMVTFIIGILT